MVFNRKPPPNNHRRRSTMAQPLANVPPAVGRNLNLDKKVQEWSVLSLWESVVDDVFKGKTRAVRIKGANGVNTLTIMVRNATTASELSFYTEAYLHRLNGYVAQTGLPVHQIQLRVGT